MPTFNEVFTRFYRAVLYFFRKKGFSHRDAEDLTQEVFLRVYEHLGELHHPSALQYWVFEVTRNVWRNRLRDQAAQKRAHQEVKIDKVEEAPAMASSFLSVPPEQEESVLDAERRERLQRALEALPPRMRQCVILRIERGLKYREIAVLLCVKIDTVKAQLHQAKEILRKTLGDDFDPPGGGWGD